MEKKLLYEAKNQILYEIYPIVYSKFRRRWLVHGSSVIYEIENKL